MRGFQWLFVIAIFCVQLKYSFQVAQVFGDCADDTECPDFASCVDGGASSGRECQCDEGFDAIDALVTSDGASVTECRGI